MARKLDCKGLKGQQQHRALRGRPLKIKPGTKNLSTMCLLLQCSGLNPPLASHHPQCIPALSLFVLSSIVQINLLPGPPILQPPLQIQIQQMTSDFLLEPCCLQIVRPDYILFCLPKTSSSISLNSLSQVFLAVFQDSTFEKLFSNPNCVLVRHVANQCCLQNSQGLVENKNVGHLFQKVGGESAIKGTTI